MGFINHRSWYWIAFAIILASFAVLIFSGLGQQPLLDYDEAIYAEVARDAYVNAHHFGFQWLGNIGLGRDIHWFEKPPLVIWLIELAYYLGGVNEFTARLPTALFALAMIALTGLFATDVFGSKLAGVLAMLAYLLAFQFLQFSKILQFDIPVGFFILLSFYAFLKARKKSNYFFLFWIAIGLGVLTKSIIGLLPFVALGLYTLLSQDWQYLKEKRFWQGLLLAIVIIAPWHIIESVRFGRAFWEQYALYHLFQRFTTGLEQHSGPWTFYAGILRRQPAFLFTSAIAGIYFIAASFRNVKARLILIAVVSIFLFFSISRTKLPPYILIIYPFFSIMIGVTAQRLLKLLPRNISIISMIGITALLLATWWPHRNKEIISQERQTADDNKHIGTYLHTHDLNLPLYHLIAIGPSPAIIFYSHRPMLWLGSVERLPQSPVAMVTEKNLPDAGKLLVDTPTRKLYLASSSSN